MQVAVDAKHKLIVEQQVTNQVVDMGLLTQTAEPAKRKFSALRRSTLSPTAAISRSRISRPVRRQGLYRMFRVLSEVLQSRPVSTARTSSNTTESRTASFAQPASACSRILHLSCAG